jgi:cobalt-zinc-cadmium efflux system outer membrane protein
VQIAGAANVPIYDAMKHSTALALSLFVGLLPAFADRAIGQVVRHSTGMRFAAFSVEGPALAPHGQTRVPEPAAVESSLAEFEAMAVIYNPTLAQAEELVKRARGRWWQAGRYPNPTFGYQGVEMGNDGKAGQHGLYVGQTFITADKLSLDQAVVASTIEQAGWQREAQRQRILQDVRFRFYDVLGAQQRVLTTRELEQLVEKGVNMAQVLLKGGAESATKADVLQAEIELAEVRILLETAKNNHTAAWRRLAYIVGRSNLPERLLTGKLDATAPPHEWETVWQRLASSSPELQAAQSQLLRTKRQMRRAHVQPIPNVNVQTSLQYDYSTNDTIAGLQLSVPLPINNRNRGNIGAAFAEMRRAEREIERVQLDLRDRLSLAMRRYRNAQYRFDRYRHDIIPKAKETLDLTTAGYRQQEFSFLRVLSARRAYVRSHLTSLEASIELRKSVAALDGFLLSGGLNTPLE